MSGQVNGPGPSLEASAAVKELHDPVDLAPYLSRVRKTVAFFEMSGCPYCLACQSRFADLVRDRGADFDFIRVKLDDPTNPLWEKYRIRAVPTVVVFERGEVAARADSILALGLTKKMFSEFCAGI